MVDVFESCITEKKWGGLIKIKKTGFLKKVQFLGTTVYERRFRYPKYIEKFFFIRKKMTIEQVLNIVHRQLSKKLKKHYKKIYIISNNSGETSLMLASIKNNIDYENSLIIYTKHYHEQLLSHYIPDVNSVFVPDIVGIHQHNNCKKEYTINGCTYYVIGVVSGFYEWETKVAFSDLENVEHFFDNYKKFAIPFNNIETRYPSLAKNIALNAEEQMRYLNIKKPYIFITNESTSNENFNDEFYCQLTKSLRSQGYDVLFNSTFLTDANKYGHTCKSTLAEAIYFAQQAHCVIGLRSGLLDVLTPYSKHVIALYTDFKPRHPLPKLDAARVHAAFTLKKLPHVDHVKIDEIVIFDMWNYKKIINNIDMLLHPSPAHEKSDVITNNIKPPVDICPQVAGNEFSTVVNPKIFYLKVATDKFFTLFCVQFWLNVAFEYNAHIYIICENENLIAQIKRDCRWGERSIQEYAELRSQNNDDVFLAAYFDQLESLARELVEEKWVKACVSHLSTFYHAQQNNIKYFWNIDADDTYFISDSHSVSKALKNIESIAIKNNTDIISLDMWNTFTQGAHWTFGITYTNSEKDWFNIILSNMSIKNKLEENLPQGHRNLDWFFTFLGENKIITNKTFYIENIYFIHFGFIGCYPGMGCNYWKNGKIIYPYLHQGNEFFKNLSLDSSLIKIDTYNREVLHPSQVDSYFTSINPTEITKRHIKFIFYKICHQVMPLNLLKSIFRKKMEKYRI